MQLKQPFSIHVPHIFCNDDWIEFWPIPGSLVLNNMGQVFWGIVVLEEIVAIGEVTNNDSQILASDMFIYLYL